MNKYLLWGAGIFIVGVIIFAIFRPISDNKPNTSNSTPLEILEITEGDWTQGPASASATLIEYSDFQCPTCGNYHSIVKQLIEEFPDDLHFAYRHFPLTSIHKNAVPAAQAAEAAGRQDKFWEMHDLIFINQSKWSEEGNPDDIFKSYAEELGLDMDKYMTDYNDGELKDKINASRAEANKLKITGTPTFFINGQFLDGLPSLDEFKQIIQAAIDSSKEAQVTGPEAPEEATTAAE